MLGASEIAIHAPSIDVDEDGVKKFFWPLSWEIQGAVRDAFLCGLANYLQPRVAAGDEEAEICAIMAWEYVVEALRCWQLVAVQRQFLEAGYSIVSRTNDAASSDLPSRWNNKRDRISLLRDRFPPSRLRSVFRPLYGWSQRDNLSWTYPSLIDMQHDVITTDPSNLIRQRALDQKEKVYLVSMRYWFSEVCGSLPQDVRTSSIKTDNIDGLLHVLSESMRVSGEVLPGTLVQYLRNWVQEMSGIVRLYLEGLNAKPDRVPLKLWTGSGGHLYRRILHAAVRRAGGQSISHDHGSGLGYLNIIDSNMSEFVTPDKFMTFNRLQAKGYVRQQRDDFRIATRWPSVCGRVSDSATLEKEQEQQKAVIETVLFVANSYRGEQAVLTPIEFDIVALDWQARLFGWLVKCGYRVINKVHPDTIASPPRSLSLLPGVISEFRALEEVMEEADIYILDYLHTSALKRILQTRKPILHIDFGHCSLWSDAQVEFGKRVKTIKGWSGSDNRLHVDWDYFREAIAESCDMTEDHSFVTKYFAGV